MSEKPKALLIAEKPSVAKDIKEIYDQTNFHLEIEFEAARGHLLELAPPEYYDTRWSNRFDDRLLPVIPRKFEYVPIQGTRQVLAKLCKKLKDPSYSYIINACDAGREGELIFRTIYEHSGCSTPILRYWSQDNSPTGILQALSSMMDGKSKENLRRAAMLRSWQDWLIGINYSRSVSIRQRSWYSIGRVMTAVMTMVVQRDQEIRQFQPKPYFVGDVLISAPGGEFHGKAFVMKKKERVETFDTRKEVEELYDNASPEGVVSSVNTHREKEYAPFLYNQTDLQRDASRYFGYKPENTLQISQKLYEKRLLSYPRTDSRQLTSELAATLDSNLSSLTKVPEYAGIASMILNEQKRFNRTIHMKKYVDDEAVSDHYAIIPTDVVPDLSQMSEEEKNIYDLVTRRLLSIFLDPYEVDRMEVVCTFADLQTVSVGRFVVSQGYHVLYQTKVDDPIPKLSNGSVVSIKDAMIIEKKTRPADHFTYDTLLYAMQSVSRSVSDKTYSSILKETAGLGTSATRAAIIKKLVDTKYLEESKNKKKTVLLASPKAVRLSEILGQHPVTKPEMTAAWEFSLRMVEQGQMDANDYFKKMKENITNETTLFLNMTAKETPGILPVPCPLCGSDMKETPKYFLCDRYKKGCTMILAKTINGVVIDRTLAAGILSGKRMQAKRTAKSGHVHDCYVYMENGAVKMDWSEFVGR